MRAGFNVYDADTHVNPAAEVLDRYVDPGFRPRLAELAPYRIAMKSHGGTAQTHQYRIATKLYPRILGRRSLTRHSLAGRPTGAGAGSRGPARRTTTPQTA